MIWLCGHLKLHEQVEEIARAAEQHPFSSVQNCACEALGKIGRATPDAVRALENGFSNRYYRARYHCAWSIGELALTGSLPALRTAWRQEEVRDVREEMARVIGQLECLLAR
jgi:hypothetical protein